MRHLLILCLGCLLAVSLLQHAYLTQLALDWSGGAAPGAVRFAAGPQQPTFGRPTLPTPVAVAYRAPDTTLPPQR